MKKALLLAAWLLLTAQQFLAAANRIAIFDLTVQSDDPDHRYIGKGICEMLTVELAKSSALRMIERNRRNEILDESELAFADLSDLDKQIQMGRLLAARYVVSGNIADLNGTATIDLHMVDVLSSQVVWTSQLDGSFADYNYFVGNFVRSILEHLSLPISHSTRAKLKQRHKTKEQALIAFAEAIDHYDKNERSEARTDLSAAWRIDPRNEAVQIYLDELIMNTPRFKNISEVSLPTQNPACLGTLQYDQWFMYVFGDLPSLRGSRNFESAGRSYDGSSGRVAMGYSLPIGKRIGIEVNLIEDRIVKCIIDESYSDPWEIIFLQDRLSAQVMIG